MQDLTTMVRSLRRPRLLVRAARVGAQDYRRDRHLQRLIGYGQLPRPALAVVRLLELEADIDALRRSGDASYSLSRHLDMLIALAGEARLLEASRTSFDPDGPT